jgi:hypothetical protein
LANQIDVNKRINHKEYKMLKPKIEKATMLRSIIADIAIPNRVTIYKNDTKPKAARKKAAKFVYQNDIRNWLSIGFNNVESRDCVSNTELNRLKLLPKII